MEFRQDESKFIEMLLYVADRLVGDRAGGATKLNKVLFFAEFAHLRRHGRPISGVEYFRLDNGPAPRRLKPIRDRLIADDAAVLVREDFLGRELQRLVPRRPADLSRFDAMELATINGVLDDLAGLTGAQVSGLSHDEPGWRLTADRATIPYELAFVPPRQVLTPIGRALAADTARRYGINPDLG